MANKNPITGGTAIASGSGTSSTDMNDTFKASTYHQFTSDATGGSNNTTTPTLVATHAISAGDVESFIEVKIEKKHNQVIYLNRGAQLYYLRIDIGETGFETTKKTFTNRVSLQDDVLTVIIDEILQYYYEPTALEKTNGFNIKIYVYLGAIQTDVSSANAIVGESWVMGI